MELNTRSMKGNVKVQYDTRPFSGGEMLIHVELLKIAPFGLQFQIGIAKPIKGDFIIPDVCIE